MKPAFKYLVLGTAVFVIALVATVPAHLFTRYLPPKIHAAALQGTVWRGVARHVEWKGYEAGRVSWDVKLLSLVLGRLAVDLDVADAPVTGTGAAYATPLSMGLSETRLVTRSDLFNRGLQNYGAAVSGEVFVNLESLKGSGDGPNDAKGTILWKDAYLETPAQIPFGNVKLDLTQEGDTTIGTLSNDGERITLKGDIRVEPGWNVQATFLVSPTEKTPPGIRESLQLLGEADASGAYTLRAKGNLFSLLAR
ncbi:MAG: type II secretion system protein N [Gammaproteobacteria bacterium]|jgi:general secretion pathway protein N|nr:type II secretion system protein N [Gammaproteobacteria bacterium]